ncbi:hypothetical protein KEJ33_06145 [Candidatus Bathyarchaeota archaeon]|nr:hypothetical protein [Candidatus Bathyarchaeota archaeon]
MAVILQAAKKDQRTSFVRYIHWRSRDDFQAAGENRRDIRVSAHRRVGEKAEELMSVTLRICEELRSGG